MILRFRDDAQKHLMHRRYASFSRVARCKCGNAAQSSYLRLFEPCRLVEQPGQKYDLWVECDECRAQRAARSGRLH